MQQEGLKTIWQRVFDDVPADAVLDRFVDFVKGSGNPHDSERILFWLAMKSGALSFADETDRAVWIAGKIKAHSDGQPLPGLCEMPMR